MFARHFHFKGVQFGPPVLLRGLHSAVKVKKSLKQTGEITFVKFKISELWIYLSEFCSRSIQNEGGGSGL